MTGTHPADVDTASAVVDTSQDAADLALGTAIREMITARFGALAARNFSDSVTVPTRPGTSARKRQDRIESVLSARLDKLLSEEPV